MTHRPRKRFGQNFLHDPEVVQRIVDAIAPRPGDNLVEIGPGKGALTRPLLERAGRLQVIELDRDLVASLQALDSTANALTIHSADALRFDFRRLADNGPLRVVGNLPYNISTPLLFHLIDQINVIRDMHFMLQREVVNRLAAEPGTGAWGRLGIMVQYHCGVTPLFHVGSGAFRPPPRVESAVVRLLPHPTPPLRVEDTAALRRVTTQAFSQRRKTLRNALRPLFEAAELQELGIDPRRRPETLSLEEFTRLANAFQRAQRHPPRP